MFFFSETLRKKEDELKSKEFSLYYLLLHEKINIIKLNINFNYMYMYINLRVRILTGLLHHATCIVRVGILTGLLHHATCIVRVRILTGLLHHATCIVRVGILTGLLHHATCIVRVTIKQKHQNSTSFFFKFYIFYILCKFIKQRNNIYKLSLNVKTGILNCYKYLNNMKFIWKNEFQLSILFLNCKILK